jgi:hypothetical protein
MGGSDDSDDEGDESRTEQMRKYLGIDFPRERPKREYR